MRSFVSHGVSEDSIKNHGVFDTAFLMEDFICGGIC